MSNKFYVGTIEELCDIEYGARVVHKRDGGSIYPVYGGGGATFKMDTFNRSNCLIVARFAISKQCTRFVAGDFFLNDSGLTVSSKRDDLLTSFLNYQLTSLNDDIYALARGAAQKNLNVDAFRGLKIVVPTITEQKRIVAILDQVFTCIDKACANAEQNLKNARELFESYLQQVFSQRGDGWSELTLEEASLDFGRGKSKHRPRNDESLYGGEYPFIQTGDVRNSEHVITSYSKTYNDKGLAQSKLWPKGTICITIAANIAETGILDFESCFPDSVIGLVVDSEITTIRFVEYLLQSFKAMLQAKGQGSAQDNINMGTFENLKFPFPKIEKQKLIVDSLDSLMKSVQKLEVIYASKLEDYEELKKSILQKAFTGELTQSIDTKAPEFSAKVISIAQYQHAVNQRDKTFGRVKAQKILHLTESIACLDLDRNPVQDAAGPNDSAHMRKAENWAKQNQFFEFVERTGGGYDFIKLDRYDKMMANAITELKPYREELSSVIDLLISKNKIQAEVFTTVHAAWNNLIIDGADINDEAIVLAARDNWHADKLNILKKEFQEAIKEIRNKQFVPDGSAKYVGGQGNLFGTKQVN